MSNIFYNIGRVVALVSVRLRKKLPVFFHILPYVYFRFQSIRIILVYMKIASLQLSLTAAEAAAAAAALPRYYIQDRGRKINTLIFY